MTTTSPLLPRSLAGYEPVGSYKFVQSATWRQPVDFDSAPAIVLAAGPQAGAADGYATLHDAVRAASSISFGGKADALGAFQVGDRFLLRHMGAAKEDSLGRVQRYAKGTRWDFQTRQADPTIPAMQPYATLPPGRSGALQVVVDGTYYWDARPGTGHTVDSFARVPMKGEPGHP